VENRKTKKTDMLRSVNSPESVESVWKKKRKAMVGRIWRNPEKEGFKLGMKD